jgi:hypothetical protein
MGGFFDSMTLEPRPLRLWTSVGEFCCQHDVLWQTLMMRVVPLTPRPEGLDTLN